jgi:hypothetical protein
VPLLAPYAAVRYSDRYTNYWVRFRSPEEWRGRACLHYRRVPFARLQPAGSPTHLEVRAHWREMLARGEPIPPPVVSATERGTYYVHDGNHRYCALAEYFGDYGASFARVRVAIIEPLPGYAFVWNWFEGYGTYLLEATTATREGATQELGASGMAAPELQPA